MSIGDKTCISGSMNSPSQSYSSFDLEYPCFSKTDLRLVVFWENLDCDNKRMLFDSTCVKSCMTELGRKYQFTSPPNDARLLGEMIFGSMTVSSVGSQLKVHQLRNPNRLMVSRISPYHPSAIQQSFMDMSDDFVDVTLKDLEDSVFKPNDSLFENSYNQWFALRRKFFSKLNHISSSAAENLENVKLKLGVAVLITLDVEDYRHLLEQFIFAHFEFVEKYMDSLRGRIEVYCLHNNHFFENVFRAFDTFCNSILRLYHSPRLKAPLWLEFISFPDRHVATALRFFQNLSLVLNSHKGNSGFLSLLLSCLLSYHMNWVSTVAPLRNENNCSLSNQQFLSSSKYANSFRSQLRDVFGSICSPVKTKVVVIGKNKSHVTAILIVLSYFIRSADLTKTFETFSEKHYQEECVTDISGLQCQQNENLAGSFVIVDEPRIRPRTKSVSSKEVSNTKSFKHPSSIIQSPNLNISPVNILSGRTLPNLRSQLFSRTYVEKINSFPFGEDVPHSMPDDFFSTDDIKLSLEKQSISNSDDLALEKHISDLMSPIDIGSSKSLSLTDSPSSSLNNYEEQLLCENPITQSQLSSSSDSSVEVAVKDETGSIIVPMSFTGDLCAPKQTLCKHHLNNLSRSMFGGFSNVFFEDFMIQGTRDSSALPKLISSLQQTAPTDDVVCIIADLDKRSVSILRPGLTTPFLIKTPSSLIQDLIRSLHNAILLPLAPIYALEMVENFLRHLVFLSDTIKGCSDFRQNSVKLNSSDLLLLSSISRTLHAK